MGSHTAVTSIYGLLGSFVSLAAFIPYGLGIYKGRVRPHLFTWLIWSIVTIIVTAGQLVAGAGPSAWCTAMIAGTCIATLVASFYRGDPSRKLSDWLFLVAALAAVPVWALTADPTAAVCLVTFIELAGYGPTVRKIYVDPRSESLTYFLLAILKYALAVLALESWSIAAAIYPTVTLCAAVSVSMLIIARRRFVPLGARKSA
jgi:hypothetical protein